VIRQTQIVLDALSKTGLLLKQDKVVPNVVTLVTGEALRTSWWSHPKGRLIFAVLAELADSPDVLCVKLLSGKDTLVHRRLWPALLAVVTAGEAWQSRGLSAAGRKLLARVNEPGRSAGGGGARRGAGCQPAVPLLSPQKKEGQASSPPHGQRAGGGPRHGQRAGSGPRHGQRAGSGPPDLQRAGSGPPHGGGGGRASGPIVKEIEIRLLAHAEQVHTELGRHEIFLEPWSAWQRRMRVRPLGARTSSPLIPGPSPARGEGSKVGLPAGGDRGVTRAALGRQCIEEAVTALGAPLSALPWRSGRRTGARRKSG
jgi:hypothetical protein